MDVGDEPAGLAVARLVRHLIGAGQFAGQRLKFDPEPGQSVLIGLRHRHVGRIGRLRQATNGLRQLARSRQLTAACKGIANTAQ